MLLSVELEVLNFSNMRIYIVEYEVNIFYFSFTLSLSVSSSFHLVSIISYQKTKLNL